MRNLTLLTDARFSKDGANFESITLPHTWNAMDGQDGGNDFYRGECIYEIPLPDPAKGKRQFVEFGAANHKATVLCDGKEVGRHEGGFSTFRFELTSFLKEKDNTLTVLVNNEKCHIYPQNADFTFFGGLYRKAFFIETEQAHFNLLKDGTDGIFITPYVSGTTRVDLFCTDADGCEVKITLSDKEGIVVGEKTIPAKEHSFTEFFVEDPHLWNGMEDPYLYTAKTTLSKDGEILDQIQSTFGYRSYHVSPEKGFFLNGKKMPLHGVCRHQDRENMGWAISEKEHLEDIELIEEIGANTIRLAHYQHDQYFYDLCDEKGFAVWAEIPYISVHMPGKDAFENTLSQMTELIAQNYNHPSILFWGIANEITIGGFSDEQHENLRALNALVKKLDPSRPTTMAQLASVPVESIHNEVTDLVSYNIYYGWYTGTLEENGPRMDAFHEAHPDKPLGISEYGVDNLISWHSATPYNHDYTEEYSCLYHHHMLKEFAKREYLWATHVWNMFDFAVDHRNEGGIKGRNCKGLITYDRKTKKDSFYLYKAFWTDKPMVRIAGRRFRDRAPDERTILVYTNEKKVSLYVNGLFIDKKAAVDHVVCFEKAPLSHGENTILAKGENAEDSIILCGVDQHNSAYDLPDIAAAMEAGNWFLTPDEEKDYGEDGYHLGVLMGELCSSEACSQVLRGWVMSSDKLEMGEKLHVVGRLPIWREGPPSKKTPREIKVFKANMTKEDFAVLEKKLRGIKRK